MKFVIIIRQKANITPLLEVDDMIRMGDKPDDRCIYTYISTIYSRFKTINNQVRQL
jgi:hypothetical protein